MSERRSSGRAWDRLRERLGRADLSRARVLVGLDLDGTLAPLAPRPEQARIPPATLARLSALGRRSDTAIAVISGRALADLRARVGLPGLFYAGNHGLEISGPGLRWTHPQARTLARGLVGQLRRELEEVPGALVEDKRLGVAIHFRLVAAQDRQEFSRRLRGVLRGLDGNLRVFQGKKTVDLRPAIDWDKGRALELIRRSLASARGWAAVFVGDDRTDEEAFRTLGPRGLTVRIGPAPDSEAEFVLPSREFIDELLDALERRSGSPSCV